MDEVLSLRTAANLDLGDRRQRLSVDGLGRGTEGEGSLAHSVVARNDGQVGHGIRRAEQRALGDEDAVHVGAVAVHRALVVETEVIDTVSLDRHGRLEVDPLVLGKVRSRDDLSIGRGIEALAEGSTNLLEIAGHTAAGTEGEVVLAARGEVDLRRDEPVVAGLHRAERTVGYAIGGVILPRATIVVGIDDGEEVEVLLRIEVLLIGHLAGVADENLVGGGLCAVETLIDRGHDIEEGSELALLEGFLKLHLGVVLSHRHATWVADDVVSDLRTIDIAAVCTLRRRTPSQRGLHRLRVDLQFQRGDSLGVVRSHPCGGLCQRATSCCIAGGSKDDVVTLGGRDVDAHLLARLARLGHGLSILDTHGSGQRARQRFATKRRGRSGERSHTTGAALGEGDREVVDLGRRIHVGQGLRHGETDNLLAVGEVGHLRSLCRQGVHLVETRGRVLKRSSPIELVRIAVEGGTLQVERIETRRTDLGHGTRGTADLAELTRAADTVHATLGVDGKAEEIDIQVADGLRRQARIVDDVERIAREIAVVSDTIHLISNRIDIGVEAIEVRAVADILGTRHLPGVHVVLIVLTHDLAKEAEIAHEAEHAILEHTTTVGVEGSAAAEVLDRDGVGAAELSHIEGSGVAGQGVPRLGIDDVAPELHAVCTGEAYALVGVGHHERARCLAQFASFAVPRLGSHDGAALGGRTGRVANARSQDALRLGILCPHRKYGHEQQHP